MNIIKNKPVINKLPKGKLFIFFGKPKTGKSTFAATWGKSLMIDLENGTTEIECAVVKPRDFVELRKFLKDPQIKEFDTIVIDTLDVVYAMMEEVIVNRMNGQFKTNYSYIGEFPMGAGWSNTKNLMKAFIIKDLMGLMRQDKNIILLLHEKSEIVKRKGESDRTVYNISLPGQTATLVTSLADVIGRITIENDQNIVSFSASADLGGSRIKALAGKKIPLSYEIMIKTIEKYTGL